MTVATFSRLGSSNTYDNAIRNLMNRQSGLSDQQEKLTSGKRVVRPSDDPTAAAQAERAMTRINRIAADQRALDSQKNSVAQAEGTLGDISNALQNFRELVVAAGNGSYSASDRQSVAIQLVGLRDSIFSLANRKDTNGLPLFSALGSALTPFSGPNATAPDYLFNGLPGQISSSDVAIPYALDGESAFMHQPARDGVYNVKVTSGTGTAPTLQTSGVTLTNAAAVTGDAYTLAFTVIDTTTVPGTTTATYTITNATTGVVTTANASYPTATGANFTVSGMPGLQMTLTGTPTAGDTVSVKPSVSIFSVLDNAIRDIGGASSGAAASQAVGQALHNIDIGLGRISAVRGQAGDLLNRADRISTNQGKRSDQLEADRSRAEDLDMITGISNFQTQQTAYQAALQSYAQVQKLSLFNYIG